MQKNVQHQSFKIECTFEPNNRGSKHSAVGPKPEATIQPTSSRRGGPHTDPWAVTSSRSTSARAAAGTAREPFRSSSRAGWRSGGLTARDSCGGACGGWGGLDSGRCGPFAN